MAPTKRAQTSIDEDDSSSSSDTNSVNRSRRGLCSFATKLLTESFPSQNKRRRTSDSASSASASSDDGSAESDGGEREQPYMPLQPFEADVEDEDTLEQQATQAILERYNANETNIPSDHGIIERVDCFNFMCHRHFSVELSPLINFIVGKNGSGKSAILTALTLCLGGKASVTNRGQSLKSFIKEGAE